MDARFIRSGVTTRSALAILIVAACQVREPPPEAGQSRLDEQVSIEPILSELQSGIEEPRRVVIRDSDAWLEFWSEAMRLRDSDPPEIDFGRQMVLAAAMGRRATGGYSIDIERAYREEEGLTVVVRETSPGTDCVLTQALTAPVVAVAVPRDDAPVFFEVHTRTQECR